MSCSCGSGCSCGSNCNCGKMYPDLAEQQQGGTTQATAAVVVGLAPENKVAQFEMAAGESSEGCGCGANCKCNPCTC